MTIEEEKNVKSPSPEGTLAVVVDLTQVKAYNIPKLVTKEDGQFFHVHKILGILSLLHYGYRTFNLVKYGSMKFDGSFFTLGCIILHALLSGSSFIFHISNTRIRGAPMIYPEFRLHSVIFAYRSLVIMLIQWICIRFDVTFPLFLRGLVVIATMLAADEVTRAHKDQGTTMRAMPFPEYVPNGLRDKLNIFYSVSQIFATAQVIFADHSDEVFAVVFPIQIAALLMTCVRKSIISAGAWHFYYAMSLLSNYVISPYVQVMTPMALRNGGFFFPCAFAAIFLRFVTNVNKYAVWSTVGALHIFAMVYLGKYNSVVY